MMSIMYLPSEFVKYFNFIWPVNFTQKMYSW